MLQRTLCSYLWGFPTAELWLSSYFIFSFRHFFTTMPVNYHLKNNNTQLLQPSVWQVVSPRSPQQICTAFLCDGNQTRQNKKWCVMWEPNGKTCTSANYQPPTINYLWVQARCGAAGDADGPSVSVERARRRCTAVSVFRKSLRPFFFHFCTCCQLSSNLSRSLFCS